MCFWRVLALPPPRTSWTMSFCAFCIALRVSRISNWSRGAFQWTRDSRFGGHVSTMRCFNAYWCFNNSTGKEGRKTSWVEHTHTHKDRDREWMGKRTQHKWQMQHFKRRGRSGKTKQSACKQMRVRRQTRQRQRGGTKASQNPLLCCPVAGITCSAMEKKKKNAFNK